MPKMGRRHYTLNVWEKRGSNNRHLSYWHHCLKFQKTKKKKEKKKHTKNKNKKQILVFTMYFITKHFIIHKQPRLYIVPAKCEHTQIRYGRMTFESLVINRWNIYLPATFVASIMIQYFPITHIFDNCTSSGRGKTHYIWAFLNILSKSLGHPLSCHISKTIMHDVKFETYLERKKIGEIFWYQI